MFEVVTNVKEIAKLNAKLGTRLRESFQHSEKRVITYPSGHFSTQVSFEVTSGGSSRAWAPVTTWPDKLANFLLFGNPGSSEWMEIAVQMNFPAGKYQRKVAGAFVKDETGEVFIAHRGKLTKGRGGLKMALVLDRFSNCVPAKDKSKLTQVILIASLDAPNLTDTLFKFALEARAVATELGALKNLKAQQKESGAQLATDAQATRRKRKDTSRDRELKLGDYFDEFAGESSSKPPAGSGMRVVKHGAIVTALVGHLDGAGTMRKSQAIDLAVVGRNHVDLYEVKTSANTTDVYTGVGQLIIHGESIAELLDLPVRRHLVLPGRPNRTHERHIVGKAEIKILTFSLDGKGYLFHNPDADQ